MVEELTAPRTGTMALDDALAELRSVGVDLEAEAPPAPLPSAPDPRTAAGARLA